MSEEKPNNEITIASGIIPYERWRCGGLYGRGPGDYDEEDFLDCFHPELEAIFKALCPDSETSVWWEQVDNICERLDIWYATREVEAEFSDLEASCLDEELYYFSEDCDWLEEEEIVESWDDWGEGVYVMRKSDDDLPWFAFISREMKVSDFSLS